VLTPKNSPRGQLMQKFVLARIVAMDGIDLPAEWWLTDTSYRFWSVEPMLYFTTRPLTAEQKRNLNLPIRGFASEVVETAESEKRFEKIIPRVKRAAAAALEHANQDHLEQMQMMKPGDIITGIDGVQESMLTQNAERYIKLTKKAGDTITLDLLRDGKPMQIKQNSYRLYYRKSDPSRNNGNPIPRKLKLRIIDGKPTQIKQNSYRLFYRESRPSRNK
jgi:hypothetical protein